MTLAEMLKGSVAACARVSYRQHDGTNRTLANDTALFDRLVTATPMHASPLEHQALCVDTGFLLDHELERNFRGGWVPLRTFLELPFTDHNAELYRPCLNVNRPVMISASTV